MSVYIPETGPNGTIFYDPFSERQICPFGTLIPPSNPSLAVDADNRRREEAEEHLFRYLFRRDFKIDPEEARVLRLRADFV